MTPRDRLQRLLFEHRTAHDPASSEREIVRMFEAVTQERDRLRKAINAISQTPHNPDAFLVAGHDIYDIEIAPSDGIRERAKEVSE